MNQVTTATGALAELRDVDKDFALPSGGTLKVLENINLRIGENEIVVILGPSGCGKSTLIRVLAGLLEPTRGKVLYRGQLVSGPNPEVAIVFQSFALFPWMTVAENIGAALGGRNLSEEEESLRVKEVIDLIGLEGFERTYPRELSGGTNQRVSIARALAREPEILCMDAPFSQVDALTAESLRAEVLRLWSDREKNPKSIIMVTQDVKEAVLLATRIVILGGKPARILASLENPLPQPRDQRGPQVLALQDHIHDLLAGKLLPDEEAVPPAGLGAVVEVLPAVSPSEMIGLLEALDDRQGEANVFQLAVELGLEFGRVVAVTKGAELLDLVDTPKQRIILTSLGKRFVKADVNERKRLWGEQLQTLRLFQVILKMIRGAQEGLSRADVTDELVLLLPAEEPEVQFDTTMQWAQYGELLRYDSDEDRVKVFQGE